MTQTFFLNSSWNLWNISSVAVGTRCWSLVLCHLSLQSLTLLLLILCRIKEEIYLYLLICKLTNCHCCPCLAAIFVVSNHKWVRHTSACLFNYLPLDFLNISFIFIKVKPLLPLCELGPCVKDIGTVFFNVIFCVLS